MKHDLKLSKFNSLDAVLYKCTKCSEFFYEKFNFNKMKHKRKTAISKHKYDPHYSYKNSFKLIRQDVFGIKCRNVSHGVWMMKNGKTYLINPFTSKKLYSNSNCKYSHVDLMVKDIL